MKKLLLALTLIFILGNSAYIMSQLMSGTYYIGGAGTKPGGGDPDFATLKAACDALTTSGISGACTLYFTESKTYTESTDIQLGVTGTSSSNTITFKPYTGVVCTLSFTSTATSSTGIDGHFVIGTNDFNVMTSLVPTHYVTIDGSNSASGTT